MEFSGKICRLLKNDVGGDTYRFKMRNTLSRFNPDDSPRRKSFECKTHGVTSPTIAFARVRQNRKSQSNFLTSLLALFQLPALHSVSSSKCRWTRVFLEAALPSRNLASQRCIRETTKTNLPTKWQVPVPWHFLSMN